MMDSSHRFGVYNTCHRVHYNTSHWMSLNTETKTSQFLLICHDGCHQIMSGINQWGFAKLPNFDRTLLYICMYMWYFIKGSIKENFLFETCKCI